MNVMALDLELNQPSNTIIEIGICIGDVDTGAVLERKHWFIYTGEEINPYITQLTTITQEMIDREAVFLDEAYKEMVELYKKHNCTLNFLTWGGGDHRAVRQQLQNHYQLNPNVERLPWEFGHREYDVKTLFLAFAMADCKKVRSGLAKSMTRVGLNFEGTKHRAIDDAYNTFRLFIHLIKKMPKGVLLK